MSFAAVILAAGHGKRMKSALPKVLHPLQGRPLVNWVLETAQAAGAERVVVIVGYGREQVTRVLPPGVETAVQDAQLGTGHAARCAEVALQSYAGTIAVLAGDVPLLRVETVKALAAEQAMSNAAVAVLTAIVKGEHAYGRIVRDSTGAVRRIVEHRDATPEERKLSEINTGTYVFGPGELFPALAALKNRNAQGEYYLTDTIEHFVRAGKRVVGRSTPDAWECLGVNTPEELAEVERRVRSEK